MQIETKKNILMPHQQKIVDEVPNKFGIFLKMRCGKTATSIRLASSRCSSALIIVPKSLREQWEEEIERWNNSQCKFTVITKETFRRDWNKIDSKQSLIWDEIHLGGCNFKSQLWKAADAYIKKWNIQYIWELTGTPFTANSWSIYSLGKLLGRPWKWFDWKKQFFVDVRMGPRMIPVQKDKYNPRKYKEWLQDQMNVIINRIGVTMSLSDISQQAEDEYVKEYFDLNKEQKEAIKEAFDPLPIIRFTANHQIENGTKKGDGYIGDKTFDCEKTKRLIELTGEIKKIAIVARYNLQLNLYKDALENTGRRVFIINGETKDKNEVIKEIDACDDCVVLINSACSAGYSLASIDTMVFASMDFSFVNYTQMCARIKNMDKNTGCTYIHLITRSYKGYNSVDQAVYDAISRKEDFDIAIFNKK